MEMITDTTVQVNFLGAAMKLAGLGMAVFPLVAGDKTPLTRHGYKDASTDADTIRQWWTQWPNANIGVACGRASGGLVAFDFDDPRLADPWEVAVKSLLDDAPAQSTGKGGHVFVCCVEPVGNLKLAHVKDDTEEAGRRIGIETRGEGGYVVVAPSVHPNGKPYELVRGDWANIPTVTPDTLAKLVDAAKALDEAPFTRQQLENQARQKHRQRQKGMNGQGSVIDAFNAAHPIEGVLERHGYILGPKGRYIRAGGASESVSVKEGRSCHWSSDDPLNDGLGGGGFGCHDAFDVFAYYEHGGDVKEAVRAAAKLLGTEYATGKEHGRVGVEKTPETWPDPKPLPSGLPAVDPFDYDLLPGSLRPWVQDISERMQCPPDFVAVAAMVTAATLMGRKISIRPKRYDDWQVVPNLFCMVVGRPSLLKSPALKEATALLRLLEVEAAKEHTQAMQDHGAASLVADVSRKVAAEQIKRTVKAGGDAQVEAAKLLAQTMALEPTRRRYITNDATVEKIGVLLNENPNGLLVFRDELIGLLKGMDREGHEGERAFYLTAWAGDSRYTYDRIGRGTLDIESALLSIIGAIQPGVIQTHVRDAVFGGGSDDGLIQRFQMTVWPDAPVTWTNIDRYPDRKAKESAWAAFRRLADLTPESVLTRRDELDGERLPFLSFTDTAQGMFDDWRAGLENRLRSGQDHPAIESHLAKYRSLFPSIALILHLLDDGIGDVDEQSARRALAWCRYLESHAKRLYASVTDSSSIAAGELARRLFRGDVEDGFAIRDVYRRCWSGLDRERTGEAIDILLSLNWLQEETEQTKGRDKTSYRINPKISESQKEGLTEPTKALSVSFVSDPNGESTKFDDVDLSALLANQNGKAGVA